MAIQTSVKKEEKETQLDLGIQVSGASQAMIRIKKGIRNIRYSLFFILLRKPAFWINVGFVSFGVYKFLPVLRNELPTEMSFFAFPGLYNAGIFESSLVDSFGLRGLIIGVVAVNVIFSLIAYSLLSLHKSWISDIVLIIQLLLNIIIFKAVVQAVWLWNI